MIIIRKDTVWGPGTKILTDDVQVAEGATLTIMPGAQIEGQNHSIAAFGAVVAKGNAKAPILISNTNIEMSSSYQVSGNIDLSFVQLDGGTLGGATYGSVKLTNSVVTNMKSSIYVWYPAGGNTHISNNVFLDSAGISAGTYEGSESGEIEIDHNIFDRYYTYSGEHVAGSTGFALNVWNGSEVRKPVSHHNAYLDSRLIAIDLQYDGKILSYSDYFGVDRASQIGKFIYDGNDDLTVTNKVDVSKSALSASSEIADTLFSFVSVVLPSQIAKSIKLFGSSNIDATGNSLDNTLVGNTGNNLLDGGRGVDTMHGGAGNDVYIVDNTSDVIAESSNKGYDSVIASVSYALSANVEALTLAGTKAINGTGNALTNHLIGNSAANILDGQAGADLMEGGAGNDTYYVDQATDRVIEALGEGSDAVISSVSYALAAGQAVETLQFAKTVGASALNLTGNEFANTLIGSAGNNVLNGGSGADALYGGAGNDTYVVDNAYDKVAEVKGAGTDAVLSSVTYALSAGQEIEALQLLAATGTAALNLTGNEFAQTLVGNNGANVLDGKIGADLLVGRGGADSFAFSTALGASNLDHIADFAAEDTVQLSKSVFSVFARGHLAEGGFKNLALGKADADDRILYNQKTGDLWYDVDGSGSAAGVKFAVLDNKAAITHADFLIV